MDNHFALQKGITHREYCKAIRAIARALLKEATIMLGEDPFAQVRRTRRVAKRDYAGLACDPGFLEAVTEDLQAEVLRQLKRR